MEKAKIIDICIQMCKRDKLHPAWIYLKQGESVSWKAETGSDRFTSIEEEKGISLRMVPGNGDTVGTYTSDLSHNALSSMVEKLKKMEHERPPGRQNRSPGLTVPHSDEKIRATSGSRSLAIFHQDAELIGLEAVEHFFDAMRQTLNKYKKYYDLQHSFSLQKGVHEVSVADTAGFFASYRSAFYYLVLTLVGARSGRRVSHWTIRASHDFESLDPRGIAASAAYETSVSLASKSALSGTYPVIYAPRAAAEFLCLMGPSFAADSFFKGRSIFSGRLGAQIASRAVNITDQGDLRGGLGTIPFDAEGTKSKTVQLVRNGRLENLLYDLYQAHRRGIAPTGNLHCSTYREMPRITPLNLTLLPGQQSLDTMVRGIEEGFYLLNTVNAEGMDLLEDRYRIVGSGLMIRHGKKAEPVSGVLLNGQISQMLQNIIEVGPYLYSSALPGFPLAPAMLIDGITLS